LRRRCSKLLGNLARRTSLAALAIGILAGVSGCAAAADGERREATRYGASSPHRGAEFATLEDLVGPVALYPDDLLAIVLPAAAHPLQIVQAARFLTALESNPDLKPSEDWDESVIALLNYPDVLEQMSDDLNWTWELGQAMLNQQEDLIAAVTRFRQTAHQAGNLSSDDRQRVTIHADIVEIHPVDPQVIYVPRYEPTQVRIYHRAPVMHYYPRAYPVYYYPYPPDHHFGYFGPSPFWGVTSAFTIGWHTSRVHYYLHQHRSHPYHGRTYHSGHRYRAPRTIYDHHHYYGSGSGLHRDSNQGTRLHRAAPRPAPHHRTWSRADGRAGNREAFVPDEQGVHQRGRVREGRRWERSAEPQTEAPAREHVRRRGGEIDRRSLQDPHPPSEPVGPRSRPARGETRSEPPAHPRPHDADGEHPPHPLRERRSRTGAVLH
jgi:hypothetical protein